MNALPDPSAAYTNGGHASNGVFMMTDGAADGSSGLVDPSLLSGNNDFAATGLPQQQQQHQHNPNQQQHHLQQGHSQMSFQAQHLQQQQHQQYGVNSVVPAKRPRPSDDGVMSSPRMPPFPAGFSRSHTPQQSQAQHPGFIATNNGQFPGQPFQPPRTPFGHLQQMTAGSGNATPSPTSQQQFNPQNPQHQTRMQTASPSPFPGGSQSGHAMSPDHAARLQQQQARMGFPAAPVAAPDQGLDLPQDPQRLYQMKLAQQQQQHLQQQQQQQQFAAAQSKSPAGPHPGRHPSQSQAGPPSQQQIQLQMAHQQRQMEEFLLKVQAFNQQNGIPFESSTVVGGRPINAANLWWWVFSKKGSQIVTQLNLWAQYAALMHVDVSQSRSTPVEIQAFFERVLGPYERAFRQQQQRQQMMQQQQQQQQVQQQQTQQQQQVQQHQQAQQLQQQQAQQQQAQQQAQQQQQEHLQRQQYEQRQQQLKQQQQHQLQQQQLQQQQHQPQMGKGPEGSVYPPGLSASASAPIHPSQGAPNGQMPPPASLLASARETTPGSSLGGRSTHQATPLAPQASGLPDPIMGTPGSKGRGRKVTVNRSSIGAVPLGLTLPQGPEQTNGPSSGLTLGGAATANAHNLTKPTEAVVAPNSGERKYTPFIRHIDSHGGLPIGPLSKITSELARVIPKLPALDEMGVIDIRTLVLGLQSGITSQVRWSLDTLARLTSDNRIAIDLRRCDELHLVLVEYGDSQLEDLDSEAVEASIEVEMIPYDEVVRAAKDEMDSFLDIPQPGTGEYLADRAAERLIGITTVLRNLSFFDVNHAYLTSSPVVNFYNHMIRLVGTRDRFLRTASNLQDWMKDMVTFFSNVGHDVNLPRREDASAVLSLLLAFSPSPVPTDSFPLVIPAYEPLTHKYTTNAVDAFAKLLIKDEPNRGSFKAVFSSDEPCEDGSRRSDPSSRNIGSLLSATFKMHPRVKMTVGQDLLTRAFGLSLCVLPERHRLPSRQIGMYLTDIRRPQISQGILAADVLVGMMMDRISEVKYGSNVVALGVDDIEMGDIDDGVAAALVGSPDDAVRVPLPQLWLTSSDGWAAFLIWMVIILSERAIPRVPPLPHFPSNMPRAQQAARQEQHRMLVNQQLGEASDFANIIRRSISLISRLIKCTNLVSGLPDGAGLLISLPIKTRSIQDKLKQETRKLGQQFKSIADEDSRKVILDSLHFAGANTMDEARPYQPLQGEDKTEALDRWLSGDYSDDEGSLNEDAEPDFTSESSPPKGNGHGLSGASGLLFSKLSASIANKSSEYSSDLFVSPLPADAAIKRDIWPPDEWISGALGDRTVDVEVFRDMIDFFGLV